MIEYKLIGKDDKPVTLDKLNEVNSSIGKFFQETETNKMLGAIRKTYGVNGNAFHVYYKEKFSDIVLPKKYEEPIKKILSVKGGLKCQ